MSLLNPLTIITNFAPESSAILDVTGTSNSVTFDPVVGRKRQTFKVTNKGDNGAYLAWGSGSATAVASTSTPQQDCDYIAAGAILTQDFVVTDGICDTIAAIQDAGPTTLEISIGVGQ